MKKSMRTVFMTVACISMLTACSGTATSTSSETTAPDAVSSAQTGEIETTAAETKGFKMPETPQSTAPKEIQKAIDYIDSSGDGLQYILNDTGELVVAYNDTMIAPLEQVIFKFETFPSSVINEDTGEALMPETYSDFADYKITAGTDETTGLNTLTFAKADLSTITPNEAQAAKLNAIKELAQQANAPFEEKGPADLVVTVPIDMTSGKAAPESIKAVETFLKKVMNDPGFGLSESGGVFSSVGDKKLRSGFHTGTAYTALTVDGFYIALYDVAQDPDYDFVMKIAFAARP